MSIERAFNNSVDYYDQWVRKALPCFDEIFSIAQELIPFNVDRPIKVLDLGAGTGLFSSIIFQKYPNAQFVLIDLADKMLSLAKERFKKAINQFQFICDDYIEYSYGSECEFDLIISSLSIHHLTHEDKQKLFKKNYDLLSKGGIFLNLDQIAGDTEALDKLYFENWLDKLRQKGALEEQIKASIQRRKEFDRDACYSDQIKWLKIAGFSDVDCVYRNFFIGLFMGTKR